MMDARTRALRNRRPSAKDIADKYFGERKPAPERRQHPLESTLGAGQRLVRQRTVATGSYVYDPDYDMMVPKAVKLIRQRNYYDEKRSDLACPAVHPGGMPEIKSMMDGKRYETKRNYYRSVARAGCEIVGFDKRWTEHVPKPGPSDKQLEADMARDIKKAWEIEAGKVPSYGPEARRLMRKQRRRERATV
jgi:hypothetical protein